MEPFLRFTSIFEAATAAIDDHFILLPVAEGPPVYLERVYCYELYHQMRCQWSKPKNRSRYVLNGEIHKGRNPVLRELVGQAMPDLLVHRPGQMEDNYAIIEVKRSSPMPGREAIAKDLKKLSDFLFRVRYRRAIYLFYGVTQDRYNGVVSAVKAGLEYMEYQQPFELWLHGEAHTPAKCVLKLDG